MSESMDQHPHDPFEYVGNLHIHSRYSDGEGAVPAIARAASKRDVDFIIINDHAHMTDSLHLEHEGFHQGVLTLMGLEVGLRYHHYLAYGLRTFFSGEGLTPQEVIDRVGEQGGLGFLAHPFEKGMPFSEMSKAYTWNDRDVKGFTGICVWNFSSRWKERITSLLHGLIHLCFKTQLLRGPSTETLAFWDTLCRKRRVAAIGGSDAHGTLFEWRGLRFKPLTYEFLLGSINVHILTDHPLSHTLAEAKTQVYEAMREGRLFIAHDNLAPARGFRCRFQPDDGEPRHMGEDTAFSSGTLHVEVPCPGLVRLVRNGAVVESRQGVSAVFAVREPGVYRVEVYRRLPVFGRRAWIFTNPFYLR